MAIGASEQDFFLEASELGSDVFAVKRFTGQEEISRPFQFDITSTSEDHEIDFSKVVNKPAKFIRLRGDEKVVQHGLISRFEQTDIGPDIVEYRATLVPRMWTLSLNYESRVFQQKSVKDIISDVVSGLGFSVGSDVKFDLNASYSARDYCVQYRESDLDFISRLMEFEGMSYFFDHDGGSDVLVITDHVNGHPKISGESALDYRPATGFVANDEIVQDLSYRERIVTGEVLLKDYNYETPDTVIRSESSINSDMVGRLYDFGGNIKDSSQGDRLARVRNEEIECRRTVMSAITNCPGIRSGHIFSLSEHYRSELNQDYLIVKMKHTFDSDPDSDNDEAGTDYTATFGCIPASVQYRPARRTPVPRIPGVMTAKLETAGGDYAYIDDVGRYKAKMPFDLSDLGDGTASKPIRMAQPYSGPGYGIHFPNHAKTELVWACIDGDVDRPMAIGTVPNPSQGSPSTAENKAQNVIRTWGDNELTFDDTKGDENIHMIATKNHTVKVTNNEAVRIGNDQTHSVGNNRTRDVGADETVTIGANQTLSVGADQSVSVGVNRTKSVGTNESVNVGSNRDASVGANDSLSVGGNESVSIGSNMSLTIEASRTESIGNNSSTVVGKNLEIQAGKDATITIAKELTIEAGEDVTIMGGKKAVIEIADQLTIKCGKASFIMKKNGDIQIKGKKIDIKASGALTMKGSKIAAN